MADKRETLGKTTVHPSKHVTQNARMEKEQPVVVSTASYTVGTKGKAEGEKGEVAYCVVQEKDALYLSLPQGKGEGFHAHFDASVRAIASKLGLDLGGPYVAWSGVSSRFKPVNFFGIAIGSEGELLKAYDLTVGNTWGAAISPFATAIGVAGWRPTTEVPRAVMEAFKQHLAAKKTGKQNTRA